MQQVVNVKQEGKNRVLELKQEKFNADGSVDEGKSKWLVPILIGSKGHPKPDAPHCKQLMEQPELSVTIEDVPADDWITVLVADTLSFLYLPTISCSFHCVIHVYVLS